MEDFEQHQGSERVVLISVAVQILEDLDQEEFRLLAKSAGADILEHIQAQRIKPDSKYFDQPKINVDDLKYYLNNFGFEWPLLKHYNVLSRPNCSKDADFVSIETRYSKRSPRLMSRQRPAGTSPCVG